MEMETLAKAYRSDLAEVLWSRTEIVLSSLYIVEWKWIYLNIKIIIFHLVYKLKR